MFARVWSSPYLLIALCALFWSANSVLGRAVHEAIGPAALSFWRWAVAALLMGAVAYRRLWAERATILRYWRTLALMAMLGVGMFGMLLYAALGYTTAVNSLLMQAALPAVTMLLMLPFGERPGRAALAGAAIAMLGVLLIVCRGSPTALAQFRLNWGDALILFATMLYAGYSILLARGPRLDPLAFAAATFGFAALLLLPIWLGEVILFDGPPLGGAAVSAILFTALFPSCLAYLCYNRAVALAGPAAAGNVTLLMPLMGSVMAFLFLGETLAGYHFAGGALIVAGIVLGRRPAR